jgi:alkylation response protein AidB-like acyl-CoA dehydrogenase
VLQFLPVMHGASSLGIAEGALDELAELANTGSKQLQAAVPMRDSETFQAELGRIEAELRAARAFLQVQAASHWRQALAGTLKDEALLTQGTQTAIWLATTCVRATDACFALAGSSALYESSPLQRRLRDLHVAAQHGAAQQRHYVCKGGQAAAGRFRRPFGDRRWLTLCPAASVLARSPGLPLSRMMCAPGPR